MTPVDDAATGTLAVTGTFAEGQTLTADTSDIADVDGSISGFTYQWQQSDDDETFANIDGATNSTFDLTNAQTYVGKYIRLTAVSTDSQGGTTSKESSSSQVSNVNDAPSQLGAVDTLAYTENDAATVIDLSLIHI